MLHSFYRENEKILELIELIRCRSVMRTQAGRGTYRGHMERDPRIAGGVPVLWAHE